MEQEKPRSSGNASQWWLSTEGKAEGPFTESYILAGLKTDTIPPDAHACPVGGQEWKSVAVWPAFADAIVPTAFASPPVPPPRSGAGSNDPMLTNPQLPQMANWICVYTILVSPVLWLLSNMSCVFTGSTFDPDSDLFGFEVVMLGLEAIATLAITVTLFIGGLRLKCLKASGLKLIKIALWADLALIPLAILLFLPLVFVADKRDWAESTTAQDLIGFAVFCGGLIVFAFEILSLVWLYRNGNALPLTDSKQAKP